MNFIKIFYKIREGKGENDLSKESRVNLFFLKEKKIHFHSLFTHKSNSVSRRPKEERRRGEREKKIKHVAAKIEIKSSGCRR